MRKKVGKEPFDNGFVLPIITCRNPRGKFFAKLSAKESGKKVGKELYLSRSVPMFINCANFIPILYGGGLLPPFFRKKVGKETLNIGFVRTI